MSPDYKTIYTAILALKPIAFDYKGHRRYACPHVLGQKKGLEKLLAYQYGGGSSSGLPPGGEWRCAFVSDIRNVEIIDGGWCSGANHSRPQTCVDDIDVQVFVDPVTSKPYAKPA